MKRLLALTLSLAVAGTLTACGSAPSDSSAPSGSPAPTQEQNSAQPVVINYGLSNPWDSLMPYNSPSGSNYSRMIYDKIYDRLVFVHAEGILLFRKIDIDHLCCFTSAAALFIAVSAASCKHARSKNRT